MIENLKNIRNIFNIPDLRKRVFFTFLMLAVYRLGAQIPTPGIDPDALEQLWRASRGGSILGYFNTFSGGALKQMTIFALGIMPYISASIILQLLTVVWPYLEKLSKEGEQGRKKITQWTRYGTVVLAAIQAFGIAVTLERGGQGHIKIVPDPGWGFRLGCVLTFTTGTAFIMWLGEQITERGIGNGISLIIFSGIVVGLVPATADTLAKLQSDQISILTILALMALMVAVVAAVVFMERGNRKIPVQYARRMQGRRFVSGQSTHLPLKVNMSGVIPPIFASSIIMLPQTLAAVAPGVGPLQGIADALKWGMPLYNLLYIAGIIFFAYFYSEIIFNPVDMADNLKKYGGFIPGIRPGKKTADYIYKIMRRLTLGGALYLAAVAVLPEFLLTGFKVQGLPLIGGRLDDLLTSLQLGFISSGLGINFYFGGTSLLIVVGVAMDTVQQVESQLIMRHYDGFLKGTRVRGRRG